jgi:6-phospho-beta-glucosidase
VKYYLTFNNEINCIEVAPYVTAGLIHADPQNIANAAYHQFLATLRRPSLRLTRSGPSSRSA